MAARRPAGRSGAGRGDDGRRRGGRAAVGARAGEGRLRAERALAAVGGGVPRGGGEADRTMSVGGNFVRQRVETKETRVWRGDPRIFGEEAIFIGRGI